MANWAPDTFRKKILVLLTSPRLWLLPLKIAQQPLSYLFHRGAFFLQGQMDINPRSRWFNARLVRQTGGFFPSINEHTRTIADLEPWDSTRRDMLVLLMRTLLERKTEGAFVELGVYRGATARLIHHYAPEKELHLFDTFEGFTEKSVAEEMRHTGVHISAREFSDTRLEEVIEKVSPLNQNVFFHRGYFPESIPGGFEDKRFAFVHLDMDLYEPIFRGLEYFYPRVSRNGMLLVHDYNAWAGARQAVDDFFRDKPELPVPMPDKSGSVLIVKQ